jgi:serine/threonine protein phosphatase 1
MHTYAIGDIHGHLDLLRRAHDRIARDQAQAGSAPVVHIGDLVDRGPDSRGVIHYLMQGVAAGQDWVVLKGNHDRMFAGFVVDPDWHDPGLRPDLSWLHYRLGGAETLASYGVRAAADRPTAAVHRDAVAAVPPDDLAFLQGLSTSFVRAQAAYVHAGIRPGIPLALQDETDLVWIRKVFLEDPRDHGQLIVHGHTAIDWPAHYGNRLNLDSGAAYGGALSAVVIEGRAAFLLTDKGRVPLLPPPAA